MALEFAYKKDADTKEGGRRKERVRDTKRELGVRIGPFEAGYRGETHTTKVDERRRDVKEDVRRTFRLGFT